MNVKRLLSIFQEKTQQFINAVDFARDPQVQPEIILQGMMANWSQGTSDNLFFVYNFFETITIVNLAPLHSSQLEDLARKINKFSESVSDNIFGGMDERINAELENYASSFARTFTPAVTYALLQQSEPAKVLHEYKDRLAELLGEAQINASRLSELLSDLQGQTASLEEQNQKARRTVNGVLEEVNALRQSIKELKTDTESRVDQVIEEVKQHGEENFERIFQSLRPLVRDASEEVRRRAFENEAKENDKASNRWLKAAIVSAPLLVGVGICFYFQALKPREASVGNVVELTAIGLILLSTLSLAVVFCSRNFASSRHNHVVNRHRSNALATFDAFAQGTSDPDVKNAILLQAAQSIFTPQTSGFIRNEPDPSSNTQIIRVLEDINKAGKNSIS